jgi:pimeloyl-ACP methyl ester carboxylesterase
MPTFHHDGVDLHYEIVGDGPPLLMIAGLAADQAFWLPAQPALAARRQLILVDNRGSGRTAPLDAPTSIGAMADDCLALLRHLDLNRVSVVGHSMGGMIAQQLALRDPQRVDRLVLAATMARCSPRNRDLFACWAELFATTDRRWWFRNLYYWVLSTGFFDNPRTVEGLLELASSYPYQQTPVALRRQVEALAAFDSSTRLADLATRTLVLTGTDDLLFAPSASAEFAAAMPNATFEQIDGAAHSFPGEHADAFTSRVLAFLERD